jgi:hypothetical protein
LEIKAGKLREQDVSYMKEVRNVYRNFELGVLGENGS